MDLLDCAERFCRPSAVCDKRDLDRLHKACEVLRHGLKERACRLVRQNAERTIVLQYGADVTPLITMERHLAAYGVLRKGRESKEFLVQRLFLEVEVGRPVAVLEVPLPMDDKTAYAHFAACRAFFKTPRELGHQGLCIIFHKYDRALQTSLDRMHRQFQAALDDRTAEQEHEGRSYRLWLTNWFFCVGCFAHDCHGGLKWAIASFAKDKDCMRSAFILHESLRHGYGLLVKHVARWLQTVVAFRDWENPEARELYRLLGMEEEDWLDALCDLQIRFEGGRLWIAEKFKERDDLLGLLTSVLLKAWKFRRFSESRRAPHSVALRPPKAPFGAICRALLGFQVEIRDSSWPSCCFRLAAVRRETGAEPIAF